MTDKEIIKALECCGIKHCCEECPYNGVKCKLMNGVLSDAFDLINRQQAEIERLTTRNFELAEKGEKVVIAFKNAKSEAIKECLEKIEQIDISESDDYIMVKKNRFNNLVKEMVGDD